MLKMMTLNMEADLLTQIFPLLDDNYIDQQINILKQMQSQYQNQSSQPSLHLNVLHHYLKLVKNLQLQIKDYDSLLVDIQNLQTLTNAYLNKIEFEGRDLFESRDIIQADGTNESYKHFFLFKFFQLIADILEYLQIQQLQSDCQCIDDEIEQMMNNQFAIIQKSIRSIQKSTCIIIVNEGNSKDRQNQLEQIISKSNKFVYTTFLPLFMNIQLVLDDSARLQNDEIQVKKDSDYVAKVRLTLSKTKKSIQSQVDFCVLNYTLIQNHAQYFIPQSSNIIIKSQRVIKNKMKEHIEIVQISLPTLGNYVLRLETKLYDASENEIGVNVCKNIRFRVM
ncbi:UNKNOWN [Stylonychia lemnae]|uniref:Uncharacterized protein n=1 Tax=Stylonychia lemnae TaxID=5949 RepID=A0A078AHK4_STYLE|nr:UNKNOWN [Stylonychia lemnae]|eukprot:CDW81760.1 UNKNOWN [Stylonychia lemnae]